MWGRRITGDTITFTKLTILYFLIVTGSEPHTSVCHWLQAIYCHGLQRYHVRRGLRASDIDVTLSLSKIESNSRGLPYCMLALVAELDFEETLYTNTVSALVVHSLP